jgi:hypothetical protein
MDEDQFRCRVCGEVVDADEGDDTIGVCDECLEVYDMDRFWADFDRGKIVDEDLRAVSLEPYRNQKAVINPIGPRDASEHRDTGKSGVGDLKEDDAVLRSWARYVGYSNSDIEAGKFVPEKWTDLDLRMSMDDGLPRTIRRFTRLKSLNVIGAHLSQLPDELWDLRTLRELSLSENKLTAIPEEVGLLTNLRELNLSSSNLTSLPESIGNLRALRVLSVCSCQLIALPRTIGDLSSLKELYVYVNRLKAVPEEIGQLSDLRCLDLTYNCITHLPDTIGQLSSLKRLLLNNNRLADLPASITQLNSLEFLSLDNNKKLASGLLASPWCDWIARLKERGCEGLDDEEDDYEGKEELDEYYNGLEEQRIEEVRQAAEDREEICRLLNGEGE